MQYIYIYIYDYFALAGDNSLFSLLMNPSIIFSINQLVVLSLKTSENGKKIWKRFHTGKAEIRVFVCVSQQIFSDLNVSDSFQRGLFTHMFFVFYFAGR